VDYFERAKRLEEIPLLQKYYEEERQRMKQVWEQQEEERVSKSISYMLYVTVVLPDVSIMPDWH